ncbi:hypothetical protein C8R42DRAFT_690591 [Lentinula raphanica]|nr:hypothetical protein C8R42DRAFT_690591 [Lentinula raphanica]
MHLLLPLAMHLLLPLAMHPLPLAMHLPLAILRIPMSILLSLVLLICPQATLPPPAILFPVMYLMPRAQKATSIRFWTIQIRSRSP